MITLYLKQAWQLLKQNLLFSGISIVGTALSISLIMMLVVAVQSRIMNYGPEANRDRTLYVKWAGIQKKSDHENNGNGYLSLKTADACFRSLKTPEAVSIVSPLQTRLAALPGGVKAMRCNTLFTDEQFWQVFRFHTISGRVYDRADLDAAIHKAVLSAGMARTLFGDVHAAVGKTITLDYHSFTVCAVVSDVSTLATDAFAQIWIPYTTAQIRRNPWAEEISGNYKAFILAHRSADFPAIRAEVEQRVAVYNASLREYELNLRSQPDTKIVEIGRFGPGDPDTTSLIVGLIFTIMMLLIVPAVNISGLTLSRIYQRMPEIGVRRAYGATRMELMQQILTENLLLSLLGGVLGIVFSYAGISLCRDWVLGTTAYFGMHIKPDMEISLLLNPWALLFAVLFCLILNLLSAGIPAWRGASVGIVKAISNE
ncbi:ABC transporter permease [uncultured Bacteroides sp.]|uniref:ABC transporter permease n=1 Tax=uncultured Bacteroides sp. TaxID=162156 RepID=UPI002AA7187E|nr:ABC transporter permease [uncultured Bacteroides sp.]